MKSIVTVLTMKLVALPASSGTTVSNSHISYIIGGIVALLILGYLIYSLMRPEKF